MESQTYQYYGDKDAGNYEAAYAMFDAGMKESAHFESWTPNAKSQSAKAGHILNRQVLKITRLPRLASGRGRRLSNHSRGGKLHRQRNDCENGSVGSESTDRQIRLLNTAMSGIGKTDRRIQLFIVKLTA
jgi:hypothetical protein